MVPFCPMLKHKTQSLKLHHFSLSSKIPNQNPTKTAPSQLARQDPSWTHTIKPSAQLDKLHSNGHSCSHNNGHSENSLFSSALFFSLFGFCFSCHCWILICWGFIAVIGVAFSVFDKFLGGFFYVNCWSFLCLSCWGVFFCVSDGKKS